MLYDRAFEHMISAAARAAGKAAQEVEMLCADEVHALLAKLGYPRSTMPAPALAPPQSTSEQVEE